MFRLKVGVARHLPFASWRRRCRKLPLRWRMAPEEEFSFCDGPRGLSGRRQKMLNFLQKLLENAQWPNPEHPNNNWSVLEEGRMWFNESMDIIYTLLFHDGYVSPLIMERGGPVIVPFLIHEGKLLIGVLEEKRLFGQVFWNLPRGFCNPKENILEAAKRVLDEEATASKPQLQLLSGDAVNPNTAYFVYQGEEGAVFWAFDAQEFVVKEGDNFTFKDFTPKQKIGGKLLKVKFVGWREATRLKDGYTLQGVVRLLADKFPTIF